MRINAIYNRSLLFNCNEILIRKKVLSNSKKDTTSRVKLQPILHSISQRNLKNTDRRITQTQGYAFYKSVKCFSGLCIICIYVKNGSVRK